MRIDCTECEMYQSQHCADCLVTALLHPPGTSVEVDASLDESLGALTEAGLIPVLKFRAREGPDEGEASRIAEAGRPGA